MEQASPSTTAAATGSLLAGLTADEQAAALALLRGTSHVSALFDADGTVRWVSPSVFQVLGYRPDEFVGTNVLDYMHPTDLQMAAGLLEFGATNPMDGGLDRDDAGAATDFRMRHRGGHWVTLEVLFNNFVANPDIRGNLTIAREATGRHALDEALISLARDTVSDRPLRRLLAFLQVRISDTDVALFWPAGDTPWVAPGVDPALLAPEGPWVDAMKRGEHVLIEDLAGGTNLAGGTASDLLPEPLARAAVAGGYVACWSIPVPAPHHPMSAGSAEPRVDAREALGCLVVWSRTHREPLIGHLSTIEQVAALAYLALSRREADRERAARLEMEQEQNRRLQELDAMKTDLVLSVSHELRTPLTSIISFVELLDDDPETRGSEEGAEYLGIIRRNAERLLHMVGDLLFLGRLESGISPLTVGPVDLPEVVAAAVQEAQATAEAKGVAVLVDTVRGRPFPGDVERVRQLVDNLLSNAVKYTPAGGTVRVKARPTDDGWHLVVADDGIGIPADEASQVFDRFFRGTNARRAQIAGSGLGLVIAQAVADLHHGSIELATEEGHGSTFEVVLRGA
ncbi:MAG TPA: PAS domain-containing sensor histidine kinase [Acidimicrobiales bacterium]|nr:PAS domain-containing sensor histidine kinase [Acidimicrobiales bacterium]